jgi:hypothetical protein
MVLFQDVQTNNELLSMNETDIRNIVLMTLQELGYRTPEKPYITQNQASKIVGRRRLESAMKRGLVRFSKDDYSRIHSRVRINREDVLKLINS